MGTQMTTCVLQSCHMAYQFQKRLDRQFAAGVHSFSYFLLPTLWHGLLPVYMISQVIPITLQLVPPFSKWETSSEMEERCQVHTDMGVSETGSRPGLTLEPSTLFQYHTVFFLSPRITACQFFWLYKALRGNSCQMGSVSSNALTVT